MLKSFVVLRDNKEGNVFYCKNSEDIQFDPNTGEEIFTIIHTTNNEDLAIKIRNNNRSTIEDIRKYIISEIKTTLYNEYIKENYLL